MPAATVCVEIFLASTYPVIRTHFCVGGTDRVEFGTLEIRGDQNGGEEKTDSLVPG